MNDYTNSGILFRNQDKKADKHPDFKGEVRIACENCGTTLTRQLAGWIKAARNGAKYLALSCKPKPARDAAYQHEETVDDGIHF